MSLSVKEYYMTIFNFVYSPDGEFIAACNKYGEIAVFNLLLALLYDDKDVFSEPFFLFEAHSGPVYSLTSTTQLIISGGCAEISAWKWSDIIERKKKSQFWKLQIPHGNSLVAPEVNSLAMSSTDDTTLYAGCGDNKIYCCDIQTGAILFSFIGHTDYIHCVKLLQGNNECLSGSEDGSVRRWDARQKSKAVAVIEPYKHENLVRPRFGKFIGCIDVNEKQDWMVCGGGPALTLWHLETLAPAISFHKTDPAASYVARFYEDKIISGGSDANINSWMMTGELLSEVPTTSTSIFDINIVPTPEPVLCASGASCFIDIYQNFRVKTTSLTFKSPNVKEGIDV